jgi:hypothetical protein
VTWYDWGGSGDVLDGKWEESQAQLREGAAHKSDAAYLRGAFTPYPFGLAHCLAPIELFNGHYHPDPDLDHEPIVAFMQ